MNSIEDNVPQESCIIKIIVTFFFLLCNCINYVLLGALLFVFISNVTSKIKEFNDK